MGLYNVVGPCVVGDLHYTRSATEPIEVDDDVAGPLIEAGALEPYRVSTDHEGTAVGDPDQDPLPTGDFAPADDPESVEPEYESGPRRRGARRAED